MKTIKITYPDDMGEKAVMGLVDAIIDEGRISTSRHGDSFCAHSVWKYPTVSVHVVANRTPTMDTFKVWKEEK